ncbi:hypothetical protein LCGC14_0458310 [marine sediment metagenome]|uniref:Uncharacterized protein n=1 Tax=marine sediment metagenome TaxID=412755 RepID=A0A0F9VPX4_9ZZZZ
MADESSGSTKMQFGSITGEVPVSAQSQGAGAGTAQSGGAAAIGADPFSKEIDDAFDQARITERIIITKRKLRQSVAERQSQGGSSGTI